MREGQDQQRANGTLPSSTRDYHDKMMDQDSRPSSAMPSDMNRTASLSRRQPNKARAQSVLPSIGVDPTFNNGATTSNGNSRNQTSSQNAGSLNLQAERGMAQQGQAVSKPRNNRQVGDWVLGKTLGAGSMGKVKLATHQYTKEKCAVKIIPRINPATRPPHPESTDPEEIAKALARDASKETRTIREASISLLLHHPYICGMREMIVHTNHYYMVFEAIDGGQMLDYIISHGRLRERAARKFARQISSALEYIHRNSIVHRDLKIENILISKTGNIKIIDFGLSNLFSPFDHLSTFCGSLYFAAPELLNAKVYTGPEVDVWSFGIVLYVLVCGKVPFDDQSMPALHAKIKRGVVEYPAWLSAECKNLLCRMLVTDPTQRATLAEIMASPWMNKGYDASPDSHLVSREPIRADELDPEVLRGMVGFEFGSVESLNTRLREVLESDGYRSVLQKWEERRDASRKGKGWSSQQSQDTLFDGNGSSRSPSRMSDMSSPSKAKSSKRFSGLDFYRKKLFSTGLTGNGKDDDSVHDPFGNGHSVGQFNPGNQGQRQEPLDPTRGYHPLISIYYLVREKQEREKVYGSSYFASSQLSLDESKGKEGRPSGSAPTKPAAANFSMPLPRLSVPESSYVSKSGYETPALAGSVPTPPIPSSPTAAAMPRSRTQNQEFGMGQAPGRRPVTTAALAAAAAGVMQHPEEDYDRSRLDDLPTATIASTHRRSHSLSQGNPAVPIDSSAFARTPSASIPASSSMPPAIESPNVEVPASEPFIQPKAVKSGTVNDQAIPLERPISPNSGLSRRFGSMLGRTSDSTRRNSRHFSPEPTARSTSPLVQEDRLNGTDGASTTPTQANTSPSKPIPESVDAQSDRRMSGRNSLAFSPHEQADNRHGRAWTEGPSSVSRSGLRNGSVDAAPSSPSKVDAKNVFLKGLFSVSTTSSKSVSALEVDIKRALERVGVKHRRTAGGFECAHVPSIDLASVLDPDSAVPVKRTANHPIGQSGVSFDSSQATRSDAGVEQYNGSSRASPPTNALPRTPTRKGGSAMPMSPGTNNGYEDDNDGWNEATRNGLGGSMIVKFEISIVKVSWLGLHGVQFRRISGDGWQYQMLAKQILTELRL